MALVLDALLEGSTLEEAVKAFPQVQFKESSPQFFDGAAQLVRWKFNGAPKGNEVPVTLTLAAAGGESRQSERVYVVTASSDAKNSPVTIARK